MVAKSKLFKINSAFIYYSLNNKSERYKAPTILPRYTITVKGLIFVARGVAKTATNQAVARLLKKSESAFF